MKKYRKYYSESLDGWVFSFHGETVKARLEEDMTDFLRVSPHNYISSNSIDILIEIIIRYRGDSEKIFELYGLDE